MTRLREQSCVSLRSVGRWLTCLLLESIVWACAMAVSVILALGRVTGWIGGHTEALTELFFAGGLIAFPIARALHSFVAGRGHRETRLAAAILCLSGTTLACTGMLYALGHVGWAFPWSFYAGTVHALVDFILELVIATASFILFGLRFYLPFGAVALFATAFWLARMPR
ncbi:hypothetical protein [Pararhizobium mangrovi]|uniref:Uncharacterized protein n=1 Tax=Pararhizobium mangrovi TaxID=2590452 RepID=A0A506TZS4_9HYPH|nr:hypothetical protein [Pararhizobium mangrovi]TPW26806.1 hypothetical protein FJU11_13440 [Pararhizobium mangrovi]